MSRPSHRPPRPAPLLLAAALVVALVAGVTACTSSGDDDAATPTSSSIITVPELDLSQEITTPTMSIPPGWVAPDTRGVGLKRIEGRAGPAPIPVYGGAARITGVVQGPDGPVPGATVLLERFVGRSSGSVTVAAGADGRFTAVDLLGGLYRVRAWLQPSLAAPSSATLFIAADQTDAQVQVNVQRYDARKLQAGVETAGITVGGSGRFRALLTQESVDARGIVGGASVPGEAVTVTADAGYSVAPSTATTGADGYATFTLTCLTEGAHNVTVTASGLTANVTLPSCGPLPTTTTTTPGAPPTDLVPVGLVIRVPYAGTLPAGAYRTLLGGCSTTFEVWRDGAWQPTRVTATAVIDAAGPIRDLEPSPGTLGCQYERIR